jgi:AAA15 family ATPase/GTPase
MLKSLKIKNFRCFEEFTLPQLGRVNLLVGKNSGGKTSVLEAVHILTSPNNIESFSDVMKYRGEYSINRESPHGRFQFANLLNNYHMENESEFEISGTDNSGIKNMLSFCHADISYRELYANINDGKNETQFTNLDPNNSPGMKYILRWYRKNHLTSLLYFPISISHEKFPQVSKNSQIVYLSSSQIDTVIDQFEQIVLTPEEDIVYESLRIIEPGINRIATFRNGGLDVSINEKRVPIGSMGYGIWRMLEITLAMVNIPGGTLLIDEIDTGLHFSVMIDLWKLICKTAEKLDIQVFATTHNSDCWKSLAEVANSDDVASNDITIHRIERGKKESIVFNEQEMAIAAERDIEVR